MKGKITMATVVAVVGLIAANGDKLLEVATGAVLFLGALSESAPWGTWSFLLALGLGVLSRPYLVRYVPPCPAQPVRREFVIDAIAWLIGVGVMYGQLRTLNGALLGLLAGFAAPMLAKALGVLLGLSRRPA